MKEYLKKLRGLIYTLIIDNKGRNVKLTPTQLKFAYKIIFLKHKKLTVAAYSGYGKTFILAIAILLCAIKNQGIKIICSSISKSQSNLVYDYMLEFISRQPRFHEYIQNVKSHNLKNLRTALNREEMTLTFKQGIGNPTKMSIIKVLTVNINKGGTTLLGHHCDVLIEDESAEIPDELERVKIRRMLEESKEDIFRKSHIKISTTHHRGHFRDWVLDPNIKTFIIPDVVGIEEGRITKEYLDDRRKEMTEREYSIWYECEFPDEDENSFFSESDIKTLLTPYDYEEKIWKEHDILKVLSIDVARFGCFDKETEILTNEGWKYFKEVTGKEKVLSLNKNVSEWMPITQVHSYNFKGQLNYYNKTKVNFCITNNHKLLAKNPKGKYELKKYENLPQEFIIKRENTWKSKNLKYKTFKLKKLMPNGGVHERVWKFKWNDWMKFLGWFVSEGCVYHSKRGRYRIIISQHNKPKMKIIKELLKEMNLIYRFKEKTNQVEFFNKMIGMWLLKHVLHLARNKKLPDEVKNSSTKSINTFLHSFMLGDGHKNKHGSIIYFTASKKLANDLQEVLCKIGEAGKITCNKNKGTCFYIDGRKILRRSDNYNIYRRRKTKNEGSDVKKKNVEKLDYEGKVYCVSTPYNTIMVRRSGCPMWSGNSDKTVFTLTAVQGNHYISKVPKLDNKNCAYGKTSITDTIGIAIRLFNKFPGIKYIVPDSVGMGAGVLDGLRSELRDKGVTIMSFKAGNKPRLQKNKEDYYNVASMCFGFVKKMIKSGFWHYVDNGFIRKELEQIEYEYAGGKMIHVNKKGNKFDSSISSPDRVDSLIFSAYPFCERSFSVSVNY